MREVLVGDVGGTSVRFAIATAAPQRIEIKQFRKYPGNTFPDFYAAVARYLEEISTRPRSALFALAGPPVARTVRLTNRPWTVCAKTLDARFGFTGSQLVNDFTAMARSVPELDETAFELIKPGQPMIGEPTLVIGPGTGLGVATLFGDASHGWNVIGGEGGHAAYPARTEEEWKLASILREDHDFISNELVCAGIGLEAVHKAFCRIYGLMYEPIAPADMLARAKAGDRLCRQICLVRACAVLGAAGDVALQNGARGGVVLAGGVAQRLVAYLKADESLARFTDRGVQTNYMSAIQIRLLEQESAPLVGAAALHFDRQAESV